MQKVIFIALILCSAHFSAMAEGNEDEVKMKDSGMLIDIGYGLTVLSDGITLSPSYFNGSNLFSLRASISSTNSMISKLEEPAGIMDFGFLYGHHKSNGKASRSISAGLGLMYRSAYKGYLFDDNMVIGIPFEMNVYFHILRGAAIGLKFYGNISSYSYFGAIATLRFGAVTQ